MAAINAFTAMEGDAVPYLMGWLRAEQTSSSQYYRKTYDAMPSLIQARLPVPGNLNDCKRQAIELLGYIGNAQRINAASGEASTKLSINLAVPELLAMIQDTNHPFRSSALNATMYIGPAMKEAIPELIQMARLPKADMIAIQALGRMGPLASNAVPALTEIAALTNHPQCRLAAQSLGEIGASASNAIPTLLALTSSEKTELRDIALRAVALIGRTPEDAVPILKKFQQGTNEWESILATLALWQRDPQNPELEAQISRYLGNIASRKNPPWLLYDLSRVGTNARPFLAELTKIGEQRPDPAIRIFTKTAIRNIKE